MALDFGEDLADEIVAHLTSDLPAALAVIDAEFGDSIVLDNIRQYSIADPTQESDVVTDYPRLSVVVPRVVLPAFSDVYAFTEFAVALWLVVLEPDVEPLFRRRARTMRAIWQTIVAGFGDASITGKLDAALDGTAPRPTIDFTPTITAGAAYMSDAVLTFSVARRDSV